VFYRLIYSPSHAIQGEAAYVLPQSLDIMDTTAQVRSVIGHLRAGDRVDVIARTAHWSKLNLAGKGTGWVESKYLLDGATYQRGQALRQGLESSTPQAQGHTSTVTNLRLEPGRDSIVLAELPQNQALTLFGRRLVERPPDPKAPKPAGSPVRDVWYLVRANLVAGWVLGRFVDLDIPAGIAEYAQGTNMVAWVVLKTVPDGGQNVPEYLVADRINAEDEDFNHIRVFTWWVKNHKYVTAYVESDLAGYFPITVKQMTEPRYYAQPSPYFRLRLVDADGRRYQKVYGLFDTITRAVGTVDGWDSGAMPAPAPREERRRTAMKHGRARR